MNESIGYTVTINIIITFIIIIFVFISNVLIYYKSNKVGNIIVDSIERYSGFNDEAKSEIERKLFNIGYNKTNIDCRRPIPTDCTLYREVDTKTNGYCVYLCEIVDATRPGYYYYKVKANMIINIPIINEIINGTVFSSTKNMYNFEGVAKPALLNP